MLTNKLSAGATEREGLGGNGVSHLMVVVNTMYNFFRSDIFSFLLSLIDNQGLSLGCRTF